MRGGEVDLGLADRVGGALGSELVDGHETSS
jgi:hypothetical protein